jgi:hypothetical protein
MLMSWNSGGRRRAALLCGSCCIPLLFIAFTTSFFHPQYFDKSFLSSKPVQSIILTEPTTTQTANSELLRPWEPPVSTSNDYSVPSHLPDLLPPDWTFDTQRDERNFGLNDAQCDAAFPDYYKEVDRAVAYFKQQGNITEDRVDISWRLDEIVRVMIHDRQVNLHRSPIAHFSLTTASVVRY